MLFVSFQLMASCWAYEPSDRPTFTEVHAKLLSLSVLNDSGVDHITVGKVGNLMQINVHPVDVIESFTTKSSIQSENDSYMQPIQS